MFEFPVKLVKQKKYFKDLSKNRFEFYLNRFLKPQNI